MLPSRFSIKSLFVVVTLAAIAFAIVGQAVRGHGWAIAVSISLAAVLVILISHVCYFLFAISLTWISSRSSRKAAASASSPFAQDRPPPQWIEPSEPEG